ncbi:MAG TPA: FHA domain-containing protein [Myxococcaceae bacterium]|nr:FHA domain-containing protein [Myxococcaceae bacterium]
MPELVFFRRGVEVLRVGLEQRRVVIGRGAQCDVVIPDSQVSRQQVALRFDGKRCLMENLSSQGTRVCGELMSQGELPDGGTLELGPWRALYRERVTAANERPTVSSSLTEVHAREALRESLPQVQVRVRHGANEFLHPVKSDRFTVGKAPTNTVVIEDPSISNHHLEVTRLKTGFLVRDLDSTNGTFQGSTRLVEAEVALNNALRLGETELVFEPVSRAGRSGPAEGLIGKSPAMRELAELIQRVAPSNATVTILGESGTGKEMVARALHARSERATPSMWTRGCWWPPTAICRPRSGKAASARTCITGSASCRWCCRRCASGGETSGCWRSTSCGCTRQAK